MKASRRGNGSSLVLTLMVGILVDLTGIAAAGQCPRIDHYTIDGGGGRSTGGGLVLHGTIAQFDAGAFVGDDGVNTLILQGGFWYANCLGQCPGVDDTIDTDSDGIPDTCDNCPAHQNPDQADCDDNGIGDLCTIAEGMSQDCTGNGIPDECEPDCNANGLADSCDLADMTSQDCTRNSIPDECEPDCDANGIADSCTIADCVADVACDDCNLNGVPDECDISSGTSQDANLDGVPDECSTWTQVPMGDDLWNTPTNWDPPVVPDNRPAQTFSAVIDGLGSNVILNIDAEIDSLKLADGATLNVTQGNLTVETAGGIQSGGSIVMDGRSIDTSLGGMALKRDCGTGALGGELADALGGCTPPSLLMTDGASVSAASMTVLDGRELGVTGGVQVAGIAPVGATIALTGPLTLDRNGAYQKDLAAVGPTNAGLTAGNVLITNSPALDCVEGPCRGEMILTNSMTVATADDFVVSSSEGCQMLLQRGGCAPPSLHVLDSATLAIGGAFIVSGNVDIVIVSPPPPSQARLAAVEAIAPALTIGGDVVIQSATPTTVDLSSATILMQGGMQSFEVAGTDVGLLSVGYVDNFAVGTLEIAPTADVTFVDQFANAVGNEALYVQSLVLRAGSTINLGDASVYYRTLIDEGATINRSGSGDLVDTTCVDNVDCDDGDVCTFDQCMGGSCLSFSNNYGDVDFNTTVNLFDLFCMLDGFGGKFGVRDPDCTFDRLDIEPCGGNSSLNLFDLFAILDSFSGIDPCCAPQP